MFNIFNARQYPGNHWPTRDAARGSPAVGLLGGVEVRTCGNGPILCDHDCASHWCHAHSVFCSNADRLTATVSVHTIDTVEWEIVGLGESPRAENAWIKGVLRELDGTVVAESLT